MVSLFSDRQQVSTLQAQTVNCDYKQAGDKKTFWIV
jgi:hypothetical protein